MFDRIRALRSRARSVAEVAAMDDRDLADLGVGRDQALRLAAAPEDTPDRMARMAAIFEVDPQALQRDHGTMIALAEACADCDAREACASTLALAEAFPGGVVASDCGFCPNAGGYRLLRRPG